MLSSANLTQSKLHEAQAAVAVIGQRLNFQICWIIRIGCRTRSPKWFTTQFFFILDDLMLFKIACLSLIISGLNYIKCLTFHTLGQLMNSTIYGSLCRQWNVNHISINYVICNFNMFFIQLISVLFQLIISPSVTNCRSNLLIQMHHLNFHWTEKRRRYSWRKMLW